MKICYSESEKDIKPSVNFHSNITNEFGTSFYMMTYHFYLKIDSQEFNKKYKNVYQSILQVEKIAEHYNLDPAKTKHLDDILSEKLRIIEKFNKRDIIYVPICYSLVSKFPYLPLMENILETLIKVSIDPKLTDEDMGNFINHIINEVPIPPNDKKLLFYLPHMTSEIELVPLLLNDRRLNNFNILSIFNLLSIENILLIFNIILMEQKILFIHDNRQKLSETIESFLSLIHPFKWVHTNICVLPNGLFKFLESFMPFIMGMEESIFNNKKDLFEDESQIVFIVNIRKNNVYMIEKIKKTKITKLTTVPKFPEEIYNDILGELKEKKIPLEQSKKQLLPPIELAALDKDIRDIFIKTLVKLIGDYEKYLNYIDDIPIFSQDNFLKTRALENSDFYLGLTDTRMFYDFIQNIPKKSFPLFNRFCLRYINEIYNNNKLQRKNSKNFSSASKSPVKRIKSNSISNNNLNSLIDGIQRLTGTSNPGSELRDTIDSSRVVKIDDEDKKEYKETFLIKPYFIKVEELNIINYSEYLSGKYSSSCTINTKIVENLKDFNYTPTQYNRYIIPELEYKLDLFLNTPDCKKVEDHFFPKKKASNDLYELLSSDNEEEIRLKGK